MDTKTFASHCPRLQTLATQARLGAQRRRDARHRLCKAPSAADDQREQAPWTITNYYTKKRVRIADASGNLINSEATIVEPAAWTSDTQLELAIRAVAHELPDHSEEELRSQLQQLQALLPDLVPGRNGAKAGDMVRVAARLHGAAEALVALREELPEANVSSLAARNLPLLLLPPEQLRQDVQQVKALFAGCSPSSFRELLDSHPQLLAPSTASALLHEMGRLFGWDVSKEAGRRSVVSLLSSSPTLADMAGSLRGQARGDRDPEYLADTTLATGEQ